MRRVPLRQIVAVALAGALAVACEPGGTARGARGPVAPPAGPAPVWRWAAPPPAYVGMPASDGDTIVFTSALSRLVRVDGAGRLVWVAERRRMRDVAPRVAAGLVVAATEDGLAAFDQATGAPRWEAALGERANTPAVSGDTLVTSTWDRSLAAIAVADGRVRWRLRMPGAALGPATVAGRVAVSSWAADAGTAAGVLAVDLDDGHTLWSADLMPAGVSGPAVARRAAGPGDAGGGADGRASAGGAGGEGGEGVVVVVAGDIAAHGFDLSTGRELWRTPLGGAGSPEVLPLPAGRGEVLVADRLGGMALLGAGDGYVQWQVSSDGAAVRGSPVGPGPSGRFALPLDDGRVLVAGPGRSTDLVDSGARVSGAAAGPSGLLLVGTREATANGLVAYSGW